MNKATIWIPLKNRTFRNLWVAGLLSGSAFSAYTMAATWLLNTMTPSPLPPFPHVDLCHPPVLPLHTACGSARRHVQPEEAALSHESVAVPRSGKPCDRQFDGSREPILDSWNRFSPQRRVCIQCTGLDSNHPANCRTRGFAVGHNTWRPSDKYLGNHRIGDRTLNSFAVRRKSSLRSTQCAFFS